MENFLTVSNEVMNKAAINTVAHVFLWVHAFILLSISITVALLSHRLVYVNFGRYCQTVFQI